jgi:hypothetical protein
MHLQVCGGVEKERNTHTHACSHCLARWGGAMGTGACRVCEWSTKIWPKASQSRGFLLSFIFAMSLCLICFDRYRPSRRLRDVVTLSRSSL